MAVNRHSRGWRSIIPALIIPVLTVAIGQGADKKLAATRLVASSHKVERAANVADLRTNAGATPVSASGSFLAVPAPSYRFVLAPFTRIKVAEFAEYLIWLALLLVLELGLGAIRSYRRRKDAIRRRQELLY
jgi:hypothetical protein